MPPNVSVNCVNVPSVPIVTAIDECNGLPLVVTFTSSVIPGSCAGNYTLTRTWSATNACANTTIASQVITVTDVTVPVLTGVPSNTTVDCASVPAPAAVNATDACSSIPLGVIFSSSTVPGTCVNHYTITRSWIATDGCGNTTNATQLSLSRITIRR